MVKCNVCGRNFKAKAALSQHRRDAHQGGKGTQPRVSSRWEKFCKWTWLMLRKYIPPEDATVDELNRLIQLQVLAINPNVIDPEVPDNYVNIMQYVLRSVGYNTAETQRVVANTLSRSIASGASGPAPIGTVVTPTGDLNSIETSGVLVETFAENQRQLDEARRETGWFSAESMAAFRDQQNDLSTGVRNWWTNLWK